MTMGADEEVIARAAGWLAEGRRVALVTVVQTWGSSPRPPGALLAVADDGRFDGSVSGGCIEEDLLARFAASFPGRPEVVTYGVSSDEARRFGLPCGGTLRLVVEAVSGGEALRPLTDALAGRSVIARRLHLPSGRVEITPANAEATLRFDGETLTSIFGPRWRLLIIGAGQLSRYVADFALALGYRVLLCDPRDDHAWDVPGTERVAGMPDDVVRDLRPDPRTVIVALTHDPKLDDMALMEALKSDAFYVGAIGSRANSEKRRRRLATLDVTEAEIARLHGPVGLPLGSRTPPEIALAILAEVTALRNGVSLAARAATPESASSACAA